MTDKKISALSPASTPLVGTEVLPIVQSGSTVKVAVSDLTAGRAVSALSYTASGGYTATASAFKILTDASEFTFGSDSAVGGVGAYYSSSYDGIYFYNKTGGVPQFGIKRTGDIGLLTGNLIPATAAKGINFTANTPAAGMTSQLLNWYEEGTFTPTIIGTTTAGTGTYIVRIGRYTRIGRQVSFDLEVAITAHTGTGNMRISGLPFTANATAFASVQSFADNLALTALNIPAFLLAPNTTLIYMNQLPVGGGASTAIPMDTNCDIIVSGVYTI